MKYKIKSIFVSLLLSTGLTSLGQEKVTTYVNPLSEREPSNRVYQETITREPPSRSEWSN